MPDNPLLAYRQEVQDYLRSCEHLLAAVVSSDNSPLSQEERDIIAYYADEVLTALVRPVTP